MAYLIVTHTGGTSERIKIEPDGIEYVVKNVDEIEVVDEKDKPITSELDPIGDHLTGKGTPVAIVDPVHNERRAFRIGIANRHRKGIETFRKPSSRRREGQGKELLLRRSRSGRGRKWRRRGQRGGRRTDSCMSRGCRGHQGGCQRRILGRVLVVPDPGRFIGKFKNPGAIFSLNLSRRIGQIYPLDSFSAGGGFKLFGVTVPDNPDGF